MRPRTPAGFYFASVCAAGFGAMMALVPWLGEQPGDDVVETIAVRAVCAVLAALSGVAAEARRWAYRATLALALTYTASVTLLCVGFEGLEGFWAAIAILFFSACVVLPILLYVRDRSFTLFGTPPRMRPAPPRPMARPVPAGRHQP